MYWFILDNGREMGLLDLLPQKFLTYRNTPLEYQIQIHFQGEEVNGNRVSLLICSTAIFDSKLRW